VAETRTNQLEKVDFIRLLFIDPVQEQVAYRWASRLANVLGAQVLQLRPETTLAQMLDWAAAAKADSMDFVVVFEPELRMEFANFLDCADHVSFRQMVEHYAGRFGS
jgi:hypothetical protein